MAEKEDSLFVSAWLELAGACNALGELKDAGRAREKAASLFAKASERQKLQFANFDTTFRPIVMGRPGATEREFLEYRTKRFPKDQGFLGQLGALYNNYGLVDQAIATYSRILEVDPDEAGALNMLGYIYAGKKREMDKGIGMQRRHVAILPRHPNSHNSMGDVYFMAHRKADRRGMADVERLLKKAEALAAQGSSQWEAFMQADKEIHLALARLAGNPLHRFFLETVHTHFHRHHIQAFLPRDEETIRITLSELQAIVKAVSRGEAERAEVLAREHVRAATEAMRRASARGAKAKFRIQTSKPAKRSHP